MRTAIDETSQPTEVGQLVDYVVGREVVLDELMELAVRVPVESRGLAITGLAAHLPSLSNERIEQVAPALRWISGALRPDRPADWRRWFRYRGEPDERRGGLDLPGSPRFLPEPRS